MDDHDGHDWHTFDVNLGWEVRSVDGWWEARRIGTESPVVRLDHQQFDQWRAEGPNPDGLA